MSTNKSNFLEAGVPGSAVPPDRIQAIRHAFLDRLWIGMLVIALVGAPASVARAYVTGWHPVYAFHLAVAVLVIALFLARRHISYPTKLKILLLLFAVIGASAGAFAHSVRDPQRAHESHAAAGSFVGPGADREQ